MYIIFTRSGPLSLSLGASRTADTGTIQTVTSVARADGLLALWNGFLPYYGRCGGHTVSMFVAVDQIRTLYRAYCM